MGMKGIDSGVIELGELDRMARGVSVVHQLDPRAKVLVTFAFCIFVVSFGKYAVAPLIVFLVYPVVLVALAGLSWRYLLRKLVIVSPFAVMVGIFNPLLDRDPAMVLGNIAVSGGWLSFASIMMRFALTVLSVLVLLATTGIDGVSRAMDRLGMPRVFTVQVMFLYRYLFVLSDEAARIARARAVRGGHGLPDMHVFVSIVGSLLVRSIDRAHRVYAAMESRGFDGHMRSISRDSWRRRDTLFLCSCCLIFAVLRSFNVPDLIGRSLIEVLR